MEGAFQVAAVCLLCTVLTLLLKGTEPAAALCISLGLCLAAGLLLGRRLGELWDLARGILAAGGLEESWFLPLCKVALIALVCRLGAELCRDGGAGTPAAVTELAGILAGLMAAVPLLQEVWELFTKLL